MAKEQNESALPQEDPRASKILNALDYLLSGKENGLIDSVLRDYTPVTSIVNGKEVKKAPGLSVGTIFRTIGFAIRNPRIIGSLYTLYSSPEIAQSPNFQEKLLNNDNSWKFISSVGERLPQIGKVLDYFKIPEFAEGSLLDSKGIESISNFLTDPKNQAKLKETALESRKASPDINKMVNNIFDLMSSEGFSGYIKNKSVVLQDYIVKNMQANAAVTDQLNNYGLKPENLKTLTNIIPLLLPNPEALRKVYNQFSQGNYQGMVKELLIMSKDVPEIKKYFEDNQELFVAVIDKIIKTTPSLAAYDITGDLYKILPDLLGHPDSLIKMVELFEQGKNIDIGKEFLKLIDQDPKIKQYFQTNSELFQHIILDKVAGMDKYGIDNKVLSHIFERLLDGKNIPKIMDILDQFEKGDMMKLAVETLSMIETDPKFAKYMEDHKADFAKIVNAVIDQTPAIKQYTANADLGAIVGDFIKDPKSIRELLEGAQGSKMDIAKAGAAFLAKKMVDVELRSAMLHAAGTWLFGDGLPKQQVVDHIAEQLVKMKGREADKRFSLNDVVRETAELAVGSDEKLEKVKDSINKNTFFDGVSIVGKADSPLKLENLDINNHFVNTKFENVSFKGAKFTNSDFTGTKFVNVDFTNTEIDASTFKSLIPALKTNSINLNGVKIVGDISGVDLSNISFAGADLSAVTKMTNTNLKDTDFRGTILPADQKILSESYNLGSSKFSDEAAIYALKQENEKYMIDSITNSIISKAKVSDNIDKTALRENIEKLYTSDSQVGRDFRADIGENPSDIYNFSPVKPVYKHASELRTTSYAMRVLYENRNNPKKLESVLAANIIADEITEKLFGAGKNRGKDADMLRKAFGKFIEKNPNTNVMDLLKPDASKDIVDVLAKSIKNKATQYTKAGLVNNGIKIKNNVTVEDLTEVIKKRMMTKIVGSDSKNLNLNENELQKIAEIANGIGKNLFGSGATKARKEDVELINENLKDVFLKLKHDKKLVDISEVLEKNKERLIGKVDAGYLSTTRTALTEIYYKNANYTSAGLASGGIYLDPNKTTHSVDFLLSVRKSIVGQIGSELTSKIVSQHGKVMKQYVVDGSSKQSLPNQQPKTQKEIRK